ncbi:molybdopterin-dependent oxidoreductase [Streptomyces sp. NPDC002004]
MTVERRTSLRGLGPARLLLGALSGVIAGFAGLCLAELVSAGVRPEAGPVAAVGGVVIDATPPGVKDWAIKEFGTSDKLVLELGIVLILTACAAVVGVGALRHRPAGAAAAFFFGLAGAAAAAVRPGASLADTVPSLLGGLAAAGVLYLLIGLLLPARARSAGDADTARGGSRAVDRRGFVAVAGTTVVASAAAGALGLRLNSTGNAAATASRAGLVLPKPASPAAPVPAGADLRVPGLGPFITPNGVFYRIDTALVVPRVDAARWTLRIRGLGVSRPMTLSFAELIRREIVERDITLTCVSNEVGGDLVGNARWLGVRLGDLLREAGVRPPSEGGPADQLVARSVDGMTIGSPVETVMDGRDALLAIGMNGEPLPFDHGFPVRMVVPGLYGYVSACKWLSDLELSTFAAFDAYWVRRSWAQQAPVKTESRIDTPKAYSSVRAGTVPVAGVAWAQHKGIERVEVRVDGGTWHTARLATQDSADTWRQWVWPWPATPGSHTLQVRATDGTGATQTQQQVPPVPDGATGWHTVDVNVK